MIDIFRFVNTLFTFQLHFMRCVQCCSVTLQRRKSFFLFFFALPSFVHAMHSSLHFTLTLVNGRITYCTLKASVALHEAEIPSLINVNCVCANSWANLKHLIVVTTMQLLDCPAAAAAAALSHWQQHSYYWRCSSIFNSIDNPAAAIASGTLSCIALYWLLFKMGSNVRTVLGNVLKTLSTVIMV